MAFYYLYVKELR